MMPFSSAFSGAFARPGAYILPMCAQAALFAGAGYTYDGAVLRIGGRVLIGLSGKAYRFASAATAAVWCEAGRRVIEAELATVDRLTEPVKSAWIERKQEKLDARARAVVARAAKQADAAKRAALLEESARCVSKWAAV